MKLKFIALVYSNNVIQQCYLPEISTEHVIENVTSPPRPPQNHGIDELISFNNHFLILKETH